MGQRKTRKKKNYRQKCCHTANNINKNLKKSEKIVKQKHCELNCLNLKIGKHLLKNILFNNTN